MIEIAPPSQADLAIYNPGGGLNGYEHSLGANQLYWERQVQTTHDDVKIAGYDISSHLSGQLDRAHQDWNAAQLGLETDPNQIEYTRKIALNTLAMGLFMRSMRTTVLDAGDAVGTGRANFVIDMGEGNTGSAERIEFKIHVPQKDDEVVVPERWYRAGNIYLKYVRPAEPTPTLLKDLFMRGVQVDLDNFETIYPYLPSRT